MFVDSVYFCLLRWWWWTEHDERSWHFGGMRSHDDSLPGNFFLFSKILKIVSFYNRLKKRYPWYPKQIVLGMSVWCDLPHIDVIVGRVTNNNWQVGRGDCVEKHGVLGGGLESPVKCMHDHFVIQETWSGVLVMSHATFFVDSTFRPYGLKSILFYLLSNPHLPHT